MFYYSRSTRQQESIDYVAKIVTHELNSGTVTTESGEGKRAYGGFETVLHLTLPELTPTTTLEQLQHSIANKRSARRDLYRVRL